MDQKPIEKTVETLQDPGTTTAAPKPAESSTPAAGSTDEGESLDSSTNPAAAKATVEKPAEKVKSGPFYKRLISRLNVYLLLFMLIVVLAVGVILVGIEKNKKVQNPASINSTPLSQSALNQINGSTSTVGDSKQTLTIESDAIFNDAVLVKGTLDVAGTIKVGGALNLPGISVSGNSNFDSVSANNLSIAGDTNILGQLTVEKGLTVTGGATFGGPISAPQLTVASLQLNSDLEVLKHIDTGGPTPSSSSGSGLGGGGTTSVSGTDTAGTVTLNFGGSASSGPVCYITVYFATKFPDTPHLIISPDTGEATQLQYYAPHSGSQFQICSAGPNAVTPHGTAAYDYIVIN